MRSVILSLFISLVVLMTTVTAVEQISIDFSSVSFNQGTTTLDMDATQGSNSFSGLLTLQPFSYPDGTTSMPYYGSLTVDGFVFDGKIFTGVLQGSAFFSLTGADDAADFIAGGQAHTVGTLQASDGSMITLSATVLGTANGISHIIVQGVLNDQSEALADLDNRMDDAETALGDHDSILDEHGSVLDEHATTLGSHTTMLTEHTNTINEHEDALTDLTTAVEDHEDVLASHTTQIDSHTTSITDHTTRLAAVESKLLELETKQTEQDIKLDEVTTQVDDLQSRVLFLEAWKTTIETMFGEFQASLTTAQADIIAIFDQLGALDDLQPVILTIDNPVEGDVEGKTVSMTASANKKVFKMEYKVDTQTKFSSFCSKCETGTRKKTFKEGPHTLTIRAMDSVGNLLDEVTTNFDVEF